MSVKTTIELDDDLYERLTDRIGRERVSRFVCDLLVAELERTSPTDREDDLPTGPAALDDGYFDSVSRPDRTIADMSARTRRRLASLPQELQRADFPPQLRRR